MAHGLPDDDKFRAPGHSVPGGPVTADRNRAIALARAVVAGRGGLEHEEALCLARQLLREMGLS